MISSTWALNSSACVFSKLFSSLTGSASCSLPLPLSSFKFSSEFLTAPSPVVSGAPAFSTIVAVFSPESAFASDGEIRRVKPRRQDTKPIDSFLVAYLGFLVDPLAFLYSIIFLI